MTHVHPDCIMPDGGDPCQGFAELRDENERLRAINMKLWNALRRIDGINDNPARFSVEINDVIEAALSS